jgi:hypothetical protein
VVAVVVVPGVRLGVCTGLVAAVVAGGRLAVGGISVTVD